MDNVEEENEGQLTNISHCHLTVTPPPRTQWFLTRHVLTFMGFIGFANVYAMRVNLSVAIVAMVNNSAISSNNSFDDTCPLTPTNSSNSSQDGEFIWDESIQGLILGSFFWGYIVTNPIGGWLADSIGGKRVFCFGVFCTSLLSLLSPAASYISPYFLTALRVLIGLGEGVTFPAMNSLMSKWVPPLERSQTVSMVYSGAQAGIVIAYPICGLLCNSTFLGGWPSAFYVFGTLGILWSIVWMLIISDCPTSHPRISEEEKLYITSSLKTTKTSSQILPIPFKQIILSPPVWAILVVHVCQNWGYYFLLTELPTYLKNVLHFDIREDGFFSALPYLLMGVFGLAMGFLADALRRRSLLSTTSTRRLFNSIGLYGPMVCLVSAGYSGCDTKLTLALLTLGVGLNGGIYAGYMNSHLDIASNYAGTLMGFTNCIATIPGFLAPTVVGHLISENETLSQWRLVFWISGIVFFVGNTFFILFISGEEQPWNTVYLHKQGVDEDVEPLLINEETEYSSQIH